MRTSICVAILVMGFSGLVAEILLLRELLIVFSGNELSIGIILGNWLILEALGSFFAGRTAEKSKDALGAFALLTTAFCLCLPAALFVTRILKPLLGISLGEHIGVSLILPSSFVILLPVSIPHGALFTYSCRIYPMAFRQDVSVPGRVYMYETVGAIIGGIVSTYYLIPHLNSLQTALWLGMLNLAVCGLLLLAYRPLGPRCPGPFVILSCPLLLLGYLLFTSHAHSLHEYSIRAQWKNHQVVHYQNSRYGNICVLVNEGQYIFFQDGTPHIITPVPDIAFVEQFVHIPLLAHPNPETVLILSGGAGGVISEMVKHPTIRAIDYAELDPLFLDLMRRFPTPLSEAELNDRRVTIRHIDGRLFLQTTSSKYDVVMIGIQAPTDLQTNRFFTLECFSLARRSLNPRGILVFGLPGALTYLSPELKNLNASVFKALQRVFTHCRAIPGEGTNLFLASDSADSVALDSSRIMERLKERNLEPEGLVPWHIEAQLHAGWQDWFARSLEGTTERVNSDLTPIGLFYGMAHWNALFTPSLRGVFAGFERITLTRVAALCAGFFLAYLLVRRRRSGFRRGEIAFSIGTTGFAGMILHLAVVVAFESIHGYVFSWIGLLVTSFMAGAACGALLMTKAARQKRRCFWLFLGVELGIVGMAVGFPFILGVWYAHLSHLGGAVSPMTFVLVSFLCGLLIGSQFPLANELCGQVHPTVTRTAGLLYAADLVGGWCGGLVGAVVLLPVLGVSHTCIAVALVKLTSAIMMIAHRTGQYREIPI